MKHISLLLCLFLLGLAVNTHAQDYRWGNQLSPTSSTAIAVISAVETDAANNAYAVGYFRGTVDFDPSPTGTVLLTSQTSPTGDGFIAKYDALGRYVWAIKLGGTNSNSGSNVSAIDVQGNYLYVTGGFSGTVAFGQSNSGLSNLLTAPASSTNSSIFMARYYTIDGAYFVGKKLEGNGYGVGSGIAVDGENLYLTARFTRTVDADPGSSGVVSLTTTADNDQDVLVAKYTTSGDYNGWARSFGSSFYDTPLGIGVDASGNAYVAGDLGGSTAFDPPTNTTVVNTRSFLVKYSPNGALVWVDGLPDVIKGMAVDAAGNSFLTGRFQNTIDVDPSAGTSDLISAGDDDVFVTKYGPGGNLLRAQRFGSTGQDVGVGIALDPVGNSYLTGAFRGTVDFDPSGGTANLSVASGSAMFLAKYNPAGDFVRVKKIGSTSQLQVLAVDGSRNVYLSAFFFGLVNLDPDASPANPATSLTAVGTVDSFLAKYGDCYPIVHVTESGSGLQDGSSWANSLPGTRLQVAISTAASCSAQVWVAQGTYKPVSGSTATFDDRLTIFRVPGNVAIYGGFRGLPTETSLSDRPPLNPVLGQVSSSTISGDIGDPTSLTDNSFGLIFNEPLNTNVVLDGFVVTGAYSTTDDGGGNFNSAIYNERSGMQVANCLFTNNTSVAFGSAFYCDKGQPSSLTNCVFRNNTSVQGGAVNVFNNAVRLGNCLFENNRTDNDGGAIRIVGGNNVSTAEIVSTTFTGNAAQTGGAVNVYSQSGLGRVVLTVTNALFQSNSATHGGAFYPIAQGGGIVTATLTNCGFLNNTATDQGGGMNAVSDFGGTIRPTLTNCSFQGNAAAVGPAISATSVSAQPSSLTLNNSVLVNNGATPALAASSFTVVANYSLFEPSALALPTFVSGTGNLTATLSPYASTTGLALYACSPAVNTGNPASATGNSPYSVASLPATDLAGNARIFGGRVDMGAVEFQGVGGLPTSYSVLGSGTATCVSSPTISLNGSETGATYQLQRDGSLVGSSLTGTGSALSFGPQSLSGLYTVVATLTASSCTLVMAQSATVVSNTLAPTLSLGASNTLNCSLTSATLSASATGSGSLTYAFTGGSLVGSPSSNSTVTVNQGGSYSVLVTAGNGCTALQSTSVASSTALPTVSVSATSGTLTCAVTSITLTATSSVTNLLWSNAATTQSITVNTGGTYSVTATGTNGCSAVSNTVTIGQNNTAPTGANLSASNSGTLTCAVQTLTLTATATDGAGLPASLSYVFGGLSGSGNTRPVSVSGLYSVTITGGNGCTTSASTMVYSNTATPTAGLIASGTITCSVQTATLTASGATGVPGGAYNFGGPGIVSVSGNSATVNVGGIYSVTVLNPANGCFATSTVSVSSDLGGAIPAPTLSASSSVMCAGSNVRVVATVGGSSSGLQWYRNGQPTGQTTATLTLGSVQQAQAGSYVLTIPGACSVTSAPFNLTVNPIPTVTILVPDNATVQGSTITLPAPLMGVNFRVLGGTQYERFIVLDRTNGFEIRQVDTNSDGVFSINRTGPFRLTVTDGNGCQRTIEGVIETR